MGRMRNRAGAIVAIAVVVVMATARPAAADTWVVTVSIINQTSTGPASSCNQNAAPGVSCVELLAPATLTSKGVWADEPWWYIATAAGTWNGTDTWQYTAPYLGYGADATATYLMPDGGVYRLLVNDDVDQNAAQPVTGASCGQDPGQTSAYVCIPGGSNWETPSAFNPSFTFVPAGQAQSLAVGSTCRATVPYQTTVDCMANGFAPSKFFSVGVALYNPGTTTAQVWTDPNPLDWDLPDLVVAPGQVVTTTLDSPDHLYLGNGTSSSPVQAELQVSAIGGLGGGGGSGWLSGAGDDFWGFLLNGELWAPGGEDVVYSQGTAPDPASRELMRLNAPQQSTTTSSTAAPSTAPSSVATTTAAPSAVPVAAAPAFTG